MSKQFEIKNASSQDIYFRVKHEDHMTFLVSISPKSPDDQEVTISKERFSNRKIHLTRMIGEEEELFESIYIGRNYEFR